MQNGIEGETLRWLGLQRAAAMNAVPATEIADARYAGLDRWADEDVLAALLDGQRRALDSVQAAIPALALAANAAADALRSGGRLVYIAAGSPALLAMTDALEIPQTYGVAREKIVLVLAGGDALIREFAGGPEDDAEQARADVATTAIGPNDCAICVSASGTTPYTVGGLRAARAAGAKTVGIAGNAGAPLLSEADIAVHLDSGPEVISGSTRLGAGTAQKAALNMISTLLGIRLGHVHDNYMVNVTADNAKLVKRATGIVSRVAGCDAERAGRAMQAANNSVKPAILLAAGARNLPEAEALLDASGGVVRTALERLSGST